MIDEVTRFEDQIVFSLDMETGLVVERLAQSKGAQIQDILLALLRIYAADARIGDDNRIGSGAFADAVDALSLRLLQEHTERNWRAQFPLGADETLEDCLDAHAYSRYNRGLMIDDDLDRTPEFINARLSVLAEACVSVCRQSDRYSGVLLEILDGQSPFLEAKRDWWQKWLVMKRKSDTPSKMQKYFIGLYAEKLADLPESEISAIFERRSELGDVIEGLGSALEEAEEVLKQLTNTRSDSNDLDVDQTYRPTALYDARQLYMDLFIAYSAALDESAFIQNRLQRIEALRRPVEVLPDVAIGAQP